MVAAVAFPVAGWPSGRTSGSLMMPIGFNTHGGAPSRAPVIRTSRLWILDGMSGSIDRQENQMASQADEQARAATALNLVQGGGPADEERLQRRKTTMIRVPPTEDLPFRTMRA